MNKTALIFGAGKTGRGFAAHLAFLSGYRIILIDKNMQLVAQLNAANKYDVHVLNNEEKSGTITAAGVYHIDDSKWHDAFVDCSVVFTAVFGNNLQELATSLAPAFSKRATYNPQQFLTVITCENLTNAAGFLKEKIAGNLATEKHNWLSTVVGFSEAIIFKTCLDAGAGQPLLTIRAQNFFELPCDAEGIKEDLQLAGLKPLKNFSDQLRRKIYTYNCINAVIAYLGAKKGYTQLYEAANDAEIKATAIKAADETCHAQVAEFGFDSTEQEEWKNAALIKFADQNVPDPIKRNAADPERKLGRDDRLVGPALLAIKHGIEPTGLLAGIMACIAYKDPGAPYTIKALMLEKGVDHVLENLLGLTKDEQLFSLIKEDVIKNNLHDQ